MNGNTTNLIGQRVIELDDAAVDIVIVALNRTPVSKQAADLRERLLRWKNGFSKNSPHNRLLKKDIPIENPKYLYFPGKWTLKLKKAFKQNYYEISFTRVGVNQPTQYVTRQFTESLKWELEELKDKRKLTKWLDKYDRFIEHVNKLTDGKA